MLQAGAIQAAGAFSLVCVLLLLVIFTVFLIPEPAFASKSVSIQKTIDARSEIVDEIFNDVTNYKKLFGENVVLVEKLGENTVRIVVKITSPISCTIDSTFEHKMERGSHVIDYISGPLKGSKLTASLSKTWNYAGTDPEEGTIVYANFYVKDVPCVWDIFVSDSDLKFILDKGLERMGNHAITVQREFDAKNKKIEQPPPPPPPPIPKITPTPSEPITTPPTEPITTPPTEPITTPPTQTEKPKPPTQPTKSKPSPSVKKIPTPKAPPKEQIPVFNQKTYFIFENDMPKHWKPQYQYVLSAATKYWEQQQPGVKFFKVAEYDRADLSLQWASEYASGELGYYNLDKNGKPQIAVTLGFFDNSEKLDKMQFQRVSADYATTITKHELGHFLGFSDSNVPTSIMYYSLHDYDTWENAQMPQEKQFLVKQTPSKPDYKTKTLDLQSAVNLKINSLKPGIVIAENSLSKVNVESTEAKLELEKAWESLWYGKKYLRDAEWYQKEGESSVARAVYENAYSNYYYSLINAEKIDPYFFEIYDHMNTAQKLEDGYNKAQKDYSQKEDKEKEEKEEQKICFLVWCW